MLSAIIKAIEISPDHRLSGDGLYHYSDNETEDSGWNEMSHYFYHENGSKIWTIDYQYNKYYFGILKENNKMEYYVSSECFFEYVKNYAPRCIDWLLFNFEILRSKNEL